MKRVYKHISLLLLLVLGVVGCSKEPDISYNVASITFNPKVDGMSVVPQSRAVSDDVDLNALGFSVVGYHTNEKFPVSTAIAPNLVPNIFDKIDDGTNAVVRKVNAASGFKLPLAKIPLDDESGVVRTYFSFFAWSVADNKNSAGTTVDLITKSTSSSADKGYPYLNITLPAPDAQAQGDVVAAHSLNDPNDYVVSAVDLDFHHLFSKLSFQAKATSGAVIKLKSTTVRYAANALYTQARYQFNASDSVGLWTAHSAYQAAGDIVPYGFNAPSLVATKSFLGSMFVIPQQLKASGMSVVIAYTVTINGQESDPITRTVPLKAIDLLQGKHYQYTLSVETDKLEVINLVVGEWRDAGKAHPMPIIPGAMSDVLLLLEGYDKPYQHSDGKWYWLDRSGYNRHCEIVGYNASMYSESDRSYEFLGSGARQLLVPALGSVTALTMNIIAQETTTNNSQVVTHLSNQANTTNDPAPSRQFYVHLGWGNGGAHNLVFDTEGVSATPTRMFTALSSNDILKKKVMWTFQKQDGKASLAFNNALLLSSATGFGSGKLGLLNNNVIAKSYGGKISHVQISNKEQSAGQISKDFASVMQRYKIDKVKGKYLPSVTDGLFACWDGRSGLLDHNGGNGDGALWVDQAGEGFYMTAVIPSGVNGSIKHDPAINAIVSTSPRYNNTGVYMINETKFDNELTEVTFETVSQSIDPYLNYFMDIYDEKDQRIIMVRPNTCGSSKCIEIQSYYLISDWQLVPESATTWLSKRSLVYTVNVKTKSLKIYLDGVLFVSFTSSKIPTRNTFRIAKMYLLNQKNLNQAYTGNLHAFRIYNRELTPAEILQNYAADKVTFSLP